MGDDGVGKVGNGRQHPHGILELGHAVVMAVGERGHQRDLLDQEAHPHRDRFPEGGQDPDGASRPDQLDRSVDGALGAGRVEDHVIPGADGGARPEALTGRHPFGPMGHQVHLGTPLPGRSDGAQADGAGPHHEHPHPGLDAGTVDPVEGDGQRLGQAGVLEGDGRRQGPGTLGVHPHLVGQSAVPAHPVEGSEGSRALLLLAGQATITLPAGGHRDHGDRGAVVQPPAEFMTEGHVQGTERDEMQVRPADP